jgi:hypothetical protein
VFNNSFLLTGTIFTTILLSLSNSYRFILSILYFTAEENPKSTSDYEGFNPTQYFKVLIPGDNEIESP